ncbi:MAG: hypothetical protein KDC05_15330 [Bacteroidales bacterium]|nr:hypothetical protein [Bacteroidales bacterium]
MKKIYLLILVIGVVFAGCNKEDDENDEPKPTSADVTQQNNGVTTSSYAPFTSGSTFDYKYVDFFGEETMSTWTVLEGKVIDDIFYVEISGFLGSTDNGYFNCENGNYTAYIPANGALPTLKLVYLKENVAIGESWSQTLTVSNQGVNMDNKYEFTYESKLDSLTVEGKTYTDIMHVHLDLYTVFMGQEMLASSDDYYWAKGVGLIKKTGLSATLYLMDYNIQ